MSTENTKSRTFDVCKKKFKVTTRVPADAVTYDLWANKEGECVEDAVSNHGFRGYLGPIRACVIKALVAKGPEFARNSKKNGDKEVYTETEEKYIARLVAANVISEADLQTLADDEIAKSGITFQSTLSATSKRGKIGQDYLDWATEVIAMWERGTNDEGAPASVEKTLSNLRGRLPGAKLDDPTSVEEVAYLLRDFEKAAPRPSVV